MDLIEIENKINEIFLKSKYNRIVFWYDENEDFKEDINNIRLNNAELYILEEDNLIYTKYYIEKLNKDTNFLVYAPFPQPTDEKNYLADMVHYSTLFSADIISIYAQELNIPSNLKFLIKEYFSFFDLKGKRSAFKNLNISDYNEFKIILGILAVLSNQKTTKFPYIIRSLIIEELNEKNKVSSSFKRYGVWDKFWTLVSREFKYSATTPSVEDLIKFLLLNYTAVLFEGNVPKPWTKYLVEDKNNAHIFIDEFMNNNNFTDIYDEIVSVFESKLNITSSFKKNSIDSYAYCDTFEIFDKNIISHYLELLYINKVDLGSKFKELLDFRKTTHFYNKYENYYLLLDYANSFISLINCFEREGLPETVEDIIEEFSNKWSYIDGFYRKFYYHYDKIDNKDEIEDLRQLIENMYVNSFLSKINPAFSKKLTEKGINNINIPKQWKFYKNNIPSSVNKHKTAVIISDGFRYGCAIELLDELNKNPTRKTTLTPMLSTIPSYTSLGMGALLPNKKISYENNVVLVDGKKCARTDERDKILKSYNENSLAVKFEDLINLNQADLRAKLKGVNLVYIYHDQIDSIGDKPSSEHKVFNAAQDSIEDIIKIIKKLRDTVNFVSFYVTADHGFIYKRDRLTEVSKVNIKTINDLTKTRRYLLTNEEPDILATTSIPLDYLGIDDMLVTVPVGVDIFKTQGSGINYVHGGASLQECIVPVLNIKDVKGSRNQRKVELQLASTNNKITNHEVMLTFLQKENISQNVLPLEASIYFVDELDERISNEVIIYADKRSDSAEDREFKEKFTLKRKTYDRSKEYYLVIKDSNTDVEVSREKFIIDMAFQDGFSFDF